MTSLCFNIFELYKRDKNLIKVDKMLLLTQDKILGKNCLLLIERQLLQGSLRQNYPKQNIYD